MTPFTKLEAQGVRLLAILLTAFLGLGVGMAMASNSQTRYESSLTLLVGPIGADRSTLDAAGLLSRTYADVLTSRNALEVAAQVAQVGVDEISVSAIADDQSRVILLIVQHESAEVAPVIATALAADLIELVNLPESPIQPQVVPDEFQPVESLPGFSDGSEPGQVRILDSATTPATELSSGAGLLVVGTTLIGLLAGVIVAPRIARTERQVINEDFVRSTGLHQMGLMTDSNVGAPTSGRLRSRSQSGAPSPEELDHAYAVVGARLDVQCALHGSYGSVAFIPMKSNPAHAAFVNGIADAGGGPGRPIRADTSATLSLTSLRKLVPRAGAKGLLFILTAPAGSSPLTLATATLMDRTVLLTTPGATSQGELQHALDELEQVGVIPTSIVTVAPQNPVKPKAVSVERTAS